MLTVLFATRNRASLLKEVLAAYSQLHSPAGGWKLVVVDNGSTDQTAHVLESFQSRLPVQSRTEKQHGKNFALNAGLSLIEGDLTVFTDDDTFPHPDWLVQMRKAVDTQTEYAMFGGAIQPRWQAAPPAWIAWVNQSAAYTLTDSSRCEGPVEPQEIYGPNMAVRTSLFQTGMKFDTAIGPRGASYAMGSETEVLLRLGRQGHKAWYVPSAVVEHFIREEQLKKDWVWKRAVRFGRGQHRLYGAEGSRHQTKWMGMQLPKMFKQAVLMATAWLTRQHEAAFRAHWRLNVFRGEAIEARLLSRERSVPTSPATAVARRDS